MAMAYAIYTGIMADTGSFRFSNTTPEAFRISHEMVRPELTRTPWRIMYMKQFHSAG
jgi:hypothetical protein